MKHGYHGSTTCKKSIDLLILFSRTIQFDVEVDEDNASASMKNGVLTVTVPKAAKEIKGTKTLSIKTS